MTPEEEVTSCSLGPCSVPLDRHFDQTFGHHDIVTDKMTDTMMAERVTANLKGALKCCVMSGGLLLSCQALQLCRRQNQQNSHLSPLRGQGIVRQVVVAAGVEVDVPRRKAGVLEPAPLPDDAAKRCNAFPLLAKPVLHPPLLALASTQTLSQLAVSHLQGIWSLANISGNDALIFLFLLQRTEREVLLPSKATSEFETWCLCRAKGLLLLTSISFQSLPQFDAWLHCRAIVDT